MFGKANNIIVKSIHLFSLMLCWWIMCFYLVLKDFKMVFKAQFQFTVWFKLNLTSQFYSKALLQPTSFHVILIWKNRLHDDFFIVEDWFFVFAYRLRTFYTKYRRLLDWAVTEELHPVASLRNDTCTLIMSTCIIIGLFIVPSTPTPCLHSRMNYKRSVWYCPFSIQFLNFFFLHFLG